MNRYGGYPVINGEVIVPVPDDDEQLLELYRKDPTFNRVLKLIGVSEQEAKREAPTVYKIERERLGAEDKTIVLRLPPWMVKQLRGKAKADMYEALTKEGRKDSKHIYKVLDHALEQD